MALRPRPKKTVDVGSKCLLFHNISDDKWETLVLLLEDGADVNYLNNEEKTPLHLAIERGSHKALELLLKYNADVNCRDKYKNTPLHYAAKRNDYEALELLVKRGANVNFRNWRGRTPLFSAAEHDDVRALKLLIRHGANVNVSDVNKNTPLHWVVKRKNHEALELLAKRGANVNSKNLKEQTPLICAAAYNDFKALKLLIKNGANVHFRDEDKNSALHQAARRGNCEALELLVRHGANVNHKNWQRLSPLHLAATHKHYKAIEFLLKQTVDLTTECPRVMLIVAKHHIRRVVAGYRDYWFNENWIDGIEWDEEEFRQQCMEEIGTMKATKIYADITYYDFLRGNRRSLSGFVEKPEIASIFEKNSQRIEFPIYSDLFEYNYALGKRFELLLGSATVALNVMCEYRLPRLSLDQIIDYLDYKDMVTMIMAVPTLANGQ